MMIPHALNGKFRELKEGGVTPEEGYHLAKESGVPLRYQLLILCEVFGMSVVDAKELMVKADGATESLKSHQDHLAEELLNHIDEIRRIL